VEQPVSMTGEFVDLEKVGNGGPEQVEKKSVDDFIEQFERNGHQIYRERIAQMIVDGKQSLVIDFPDIQEFDSDLAKETIFTPDAIFDDFKKAVYEAMRAENVSYANRYGKEIKIRFRGLPELTPIRDVNVALIDRLFAAAGVVIRASERKNIAIDAVFDDSYGHRNHVIQTDDVLRYPTA
jgi:DNA replicative helicase MCM subunit Mcm2 (Cdc46/Mcm family)